MVSTSVVLAAKAAAAILTDEQSRKKLGWVIAAILSPVIVLAVLLFSLLSGTSAHNNAVVETAFYSGASGANIPPEYQAELVKVQKMFSDLDAAVAALNAQAEGGVMLDATRVKAVFFALQFGIDAPTSIDAATFADCFVTFETRTYPSAAADGTGSEKTYTIAVPLPLDTAYANLSARLSAEITPEMRANAEKICQMITAGGSSGSTAILPPSPPLVSADGFCSPLGTGWQERVSSEYGWRNCPYHGRELHSGLDMAAPAGTPIVAALSGVVIKSSYDKSLGNYTLVDHENSLTTGYAHQSQRLVSVGDTVAAGQIIGLVGSTGNSTGPHLHLEVRANGQLQNPMDYLP